MSYCLKFISGSEKLGARRLERLAADGVVGCAALAFAAGSACPNAHSMEDEMNRIDRTALRINNHANMPILSCAAALLRRQSLQRRFIWSGRHALLTNDRRHIA